MPTRLRLLGPSAIAIAAVIMLVWSWGTWPDPLVDFGTQLYIPWRITTGQVLYRDIAYFNGPLSQYFNAALFAIAGVGLRTIVWANIAIALAMVAMLYRILLRIGSPLTATLGGVMFVCLFAFARFDRIGNFNWVCPFRQETTHGMALSLAAMLCLFRYATNFRVRWLVASGLLVGLVFLTKAEVFLPLFVAMLAGIALILRMHGAVRHVILFIVFAALPIVAAFLLLWCAMPAHTAFLGTLGSLPWLFNRQIVALDFYREGVGLIDPAANFLEMCRWSLGYAAIFGLAVGIGWSIRASRWRNWATGILSAIIVLAAAAWCVLGQDLRINWLSAMSPLTPITLLAAAMAVCPLLRRPISVEASVAVLRLVLCVFALALLGRMPLRARITDYGFTAALPAFVVMIDLLAGQLPAYLDRRGRSGAVVRGTAIGASAALLAIYLAIMAVHIDQQTIEVAAGRDRFFADTRGTEINAALRQLEQFPPKQTLVVFPQGRMLNFLSRREDPVWLGDFMPPEILSVEETGALEALRRNPPDIVILTGKDIRDGSFIFSIGDYHYGQPTLSWIESHYRRIAPVPSDGELQFEFWQRQDPVQP
jgi:Dolichyl-phosphate-mannose-protein mannosyltransferase